MIQTRRAQRTFGDGLIAEEVKDLHEEWMKHADQVLGDKEIVAAVYEALAKRHPQSRSRGRPGTPAEVVLRLLVLKHMRNWSYGVLEREVRANLVYREFTRVGGTKMPDAKTMGRWGVAVGPEAVKQIHERIVQIARDHRVAEGRRMRIDTTVVETNIHYPTDSSLLGDGCGRSRGRRAPKADRAATDWRRPTADYWRQPAGWWDRQSASPRRSATASSGRLTSGGRSCSRGCVASWRAWCRACGR